MSGSKMKPLKPIRPPQEHAYSHFRKKKVLKSNNRINYSYVKNRRSGSATTTTSISDEKVGEVDVPILEKYEIIKRLGKGAYGIVWEALDVKEHRRIALKKIFDAFQNDTDAQRTYREIFFLREFGQHPNIITLLNGHTAKNHIDFYLVFPLMVTDLHKMIKHQPDQLRGDTIRSIMYEICKAVLYIHSADVIHRDIKPANILIGSKLEVKLGDFGLARSLQISTVSMGDGHPEMTDYVATRWYRPPEILLNTRTYTKAIDVWSLGCILGEMIGKVALFPGANTVEQVEIVLSIIEKPTIFEIDSIASESMRSIAHSVMKFRNPPIRERLKDQDNDVLDFLEHVLVFNPEKRLTIEEVLSHPLFKWHRCVGEEVRLSRTVSPPVDDNTAYPMTTYRQLLYEMVENGKLRLFSPRKSLMVNQIVLSNHHTRTSKNVNGNDSGGGGDNRLPHKKASCARQLPKIITDEILDTNLSMCVPHTSHSGAGDSQSQQFHSLNLEEASVHVPRPTSECPDKSSNPVLERTKVISLKMNKLYRQIPKDELTKPNYRKLNARMGTAPPCFPTTILQSRFPVSSSITPHHHKTQSHNRLDSLNVTPRDKKNCTSTSCIHATVKERKMQEFKSKLREINSEMSVLRVSPDHIPRSTPRNKFQSPMNRSQTKPSTTFVKLICPP